MENKKLYVGNLNYRTTQEDLTNHFGTYGEIVSVRIIEGKGFGFIEMGSEDSAKKAIENLNGTEFLGRTLRIDLAQPPKENDRFDRRPRNNNSSSNYRSR